MSPTDDPIERAFAPLRTPHEPTAEEIRAVHRGAERLTVVPLRRARPAIAVVVLAAITVIIAVTSAVDRSQPGTFVGEAGAREVLRAAADATRGDGVLTGWQWSRTTTVDLRVLEGRRCKTCPTERGTIEYRSVQDVWTAPDGETYWTGTGQNGTPVDNEPLLRAAGLMNAAGKTPPRMGPAGMHVLPAAPGDEDTNAAGLGMPGWIAEPAAVPTDPSALVRWVRRRIAAQDRAWRKQAKDDRQRGTMSSMISGDARVALVLVDLATSPQLAGTQQSAAFDALATLADVKIEPVPAAFAAPNRIAVRIVGGEAVRRSAPIARPDRVVIFDRDSFRVVAEQTDDQGRHPGASFIFMGPKSRVRLKMVPGGSGERRFASPVAVDAPGHDDTGRVLLDINDVQKVGRDGRMLDPPKVPEPARPK